MKGAIIYKGKYGATRQYAGWLGDVLQLPVVEMEAAGPEIIARFDYLLLGASVYMGKTQHKEWLQKNTAILRNKTLFHFIVCGTPLSQKEKLEQIVKNNLPAALQRPASVWFLRGRMIIGKLSWIDRLVLRIGARLEKNPETRKQMLQDFDEVKQEKLISLVGAVNVYIKQNTHVPSHLSVS